MSQTIPTLNQSEFEWQNNQPRTVATSFYPTNEWSIGNNKHIVDMYYDIEYTTYIAKEGLYCYFGGAQNNNYIQLPATNSSQTVRTTLKVPDDYWSQSYGDNATMELVVRPIHASGLKSTAPKKIVSISLIVVAEDDAEASTCTVETVSLGAAQTVQIINNLPSGLSHDVIWQYGSNDNLVEKTIYNTPSRTISFTPTSDEITKILNSTPTNIAQGVVYVKTYNDDGVLIGEMQSQECFLNIVQTPTVSIQPTRALADPLNPPSQALQEAFGEDVFVQGWTIMKFVPSITLVPGTTNNVSIDVYSSSGEVVPPAAGQTEWKIIGYSPGPITVTCSVKDSRGLSGMTTYTNNVEQCSKPTCLSVSVHRCLDDQHTEENDEGQYAYLTVSFKRNTIEGNQQVTVSAQGYTIQSIPVEVGNLAQIQSSAVSGTVNLVVGDNSFLKDDTFQIRITITDSFNLVSETSTVTIGPATYTIHRQSGGYGVAFGKISEYVGVEVKEDWPFYTHGCEIEHLIVDAAHPIGSIIETLDNSFDPNVNWPWTLWGKIEDKFLRASSQTVETGSIGGQANTTTTLDLTIPSITSKGKIGYTDLPPYTAFTNGQDATLKDLISTNNESLNFYFQGGNTIYRRGHRLDSSQTDFVVTSEPEPHSETISVDTIPPYIAVNIWVRTR